MANQPAKIKQADATRMFRAARNAGYEHTRLIVHPDGRIEVVASNQPDQAAGKSMWDEVLK